jgi:hypothetical protein
MTKPVIVDFARRLDANVPLYQLGIQLVQIGDILKSHWGIERIR